MTHHQSPPDAPAVNPGLWADVKGAFLGTRHDYTKGSLGRAIFLLSVPMVLEMLMQAIFEVADVYFVSKLGADAVAAVGISASLLILVFTIGIGLSMAATAVVARRIGEKDPEGGAVAAFQALLLTCSISVPIAILGAIFAPEMLEIMGATPEVVSIGATYCAILFGTNITILLLFLLNAVFRGTGDAVLAMRVLWIANGLNIILDPIFIFGLGPIPAFGVKGAAIATALGRGVGVAYQLYLLTRGTGRLQWAKRHVRLVPDVMRGLLKVSGPGMVQYLVGTASWLVLIRILSAFGSAALAGYTIALRIFVFALLPSWGLGNAAATLVGQNLGAGKPDRAERSVWITSWANVTFLVGFTAALLIWSEELMLLFTPETEVVYFGALCLTIVGYSYVFLAFGMVTVQAFNGAGDTTTPTWINLISYWIVQIPLAYALAHPFGLGAKGVFIAITVAQAVLAVIGVAWFRRGKWKMMEV